jgi:alcohol dehydrogenase YqhD (iron-dependent ADH family)
MINFEFQNTTKIIFGKDTETEVGSHAREYGKRILLHYGGGSIKKSGLYDRVLASLKSEGLEVFELSGVKPNPRLSLVQEGIELCRSEKIDLILAVGGGSVIDSAKSIGVGVPYKGDVWDFFTGKADPQTSLPVATVLTIPAAGSESSSSSVITKEEGGLKRSFDTPVCYPVFSIVNPELHFTLPAYQIACGTSDILAHMIERYFTNVDHVDLTDHLIEGALRVVLKHAPRLLEDPENYESWAEVSWAGSLAHNNLLHTGRIGDWASHMIEHELSGMFDIAHGAGLAIVIPAWMKYTMEHDIQRFAQFAVRVFGVEMDFKEPEKTAREGIRRLEEHFSNMGLAVRLSAVDIDEASFAPMADKATDGGTHTLGNFVKIDKEGVVRIFKLAL